MVMKGVSSLEKMIVNIKKYTEHCIDFKGSVKVGVSKRIRLMQVL